MTVPKTLVTMYTADPDTFYADVKDRNGVGFNLSIVDSGYFLAQIVLSFTAGTIVDVTGLNQMYMVISSACGFTSAYFALSLAYDRPTSGRHSLKI